MLTKLQNDTITQVGKGTPMGTLMRRYWHPIAVSTELPQNDSNPIVRKLLGEKFVLFRDSDGHVGVLDEWCPHRGVSLALGRVEDGGIRCLYHGWKFDVSGNLLDTPNHPDPKFRQHIKAGAYPVEEHAGLVWTYIGPKDQQPPFRHFAYETVPDENRIVLRCNANANFVQMWEGGADSSHVSILHTNVTRPSWLAKSSRETTAGDFQMVKPVWDDVAPKLEIQETGFGFHYAALRKLPEGMTNVRVTPIFMPYGRMIQFDTFFNTVFEVPMDDENTATYYVDCSRIRTMKYEERLQRSGFRDPKVFSDNTFHPTADNGFLQDRTAMAEKRSWSGFDGLTQEDNVMAASMGPINDRTREKLVAADGAVVKLRQLLMDALERSEAGGVPHGLEYPDMSHMLGLDTNINSAQSWKDTIAFHLEHYPVPSESVSKA